jgi:hypothetical protein
MTERDPYLDPQIDDPRRFTTWPSTIFEDCGVTSPEVPKPKELAPFGLAQGS